MTVVSTAMITASTITVIAITPPATVQAELHWCSDDLHLCIDNASMILLVQVNILQWPVFSTLPHLSMWWSSPIARCCVVETALRERRKG